MVRSFPAVVAVSLLIAGAGLAGCGGSSPASQGAGAPSAGSAQASPAGPQAVPGGNEATAAGGAKFTHRLRPALADGRPHHRRPSRGMPFRYR